MAITTPDGTLDSQQNFYNHDYQPLKRRGRGDYRSYLLPIKYASFFSAAILLLTIVVWSNWQEDSWDSLPQDTLHPDNVNLSVKNARYAGLDSGKLPFSITADEVIQDSDRPDDLVMVSPQADIVLDKGKWLYIWADDAVIKSKNRRLLLENNVNIHFSDGYELQTQEARMNMQLGIIIGDKPVEAQGIDINFQSTGFRLHNSGRSLDFVGPADLTKTQNHEVTNIQAEKNLQWHSAENKYIAIGNVKVVTNSFHLNADRIEVFYEKISGEGQELQWMKAIGNVRLDSADGTIHADTATYQIAEQRVQFNGKELILDSQEVRLIADESLEYNALQETATARGNAHIQSKGGKILRADLIQAKFSYINGIREIAYATAERDIFIDTGDSQISGSDGHYDFRAQKGRICGNTRIIKDGNELKGDCTTIDMRTGISSIESSGQDTGRIRGTFQPQE